MKLESLANIVIIFVSYLCVNHVNAKEDFCTSTECIHASALMLERINIDANPCENFYDFACGSFIDDTLVPDELYTVSVTGQYKDKVDQQLYSFIQQPNGELERLMYELHEACMERNDLHTEDDGVKELKEMIEKLGGWPLIMNETEWNENDDTKWSLSEKIQEIRVMFGHRTDKIIDITSFILLLQSDTDNSVSYSSSHRRPYKDYISQTAYTLSPVDQNIHVNKSEIDDMLDFEYKLNKLNYRLRRLSSKFDLKAQSKDFVENLFALQWFEYFHPSQLRDVTAEIKEIDSDNESINVFDEMRDLLSSTSIRTQANFLIWRLLDYAGSQIAGPIKIFKFQFERKVNGRMDMEQLWKHCIDVVQHELPYASGAIITKNLPNDFKSSINEIYIRVKEEFAQLIAKTALLDDTEREKLKSKLQTLIPLISHPTAGFNQSEIVEFYNEIKINSKHYITNLIQLRIIDADNKFKQTYATASVNDVENWKKYLPPTSLAAFYSDSDNTLRISTSVLMQIINSDNSMKFLNYGTTGFIIAHEISHIVNQFINQANTWPEKYRNEFMARKQCLIEQYNVYQDPETLKMLDGKRLVSENIADLTGIRLAYGAYDRWNREFNGTRRKLIGVDFTQNQLFWIHTAQKFCSVTREEEIKRKIDNDFKATDRYRVIGMVQNSENFATDFKCAMNHVKKCVIW
ncbi:hypothetical protein PVAND_011270 [Polypedilum vanderplanki]|uniref:Uncharacterized protein n=1 Tax=Polypedilum vanderplanki TaxID=319348 RepID=A0A9J6CJ14_POLVA|nr:hypothetical protein PVAND_011270 [Polypedilum vanderplanki]